MPRKALDREMKQLLALHGASHRHPLRTFFSSALKLISERAECHLHTNEDFRAVEQRI